MKCQSHLVSCDQSSASGKWDGVSSFGSATRAGLPHQDTGDRWENTESSCCGIFQLSSLQGHPSDTPPRRPQVAEGACATTTMMSDVEADARRISQVINVAALRRFEEMSKKAAGVQASKTPGARRLRESGLPADALPFVIDPRVGYACLAVNLNMMWGGGGRRWQRTYPVSALAWLAAWCGCVWSGVGQRSWLLPYPPSPDVKAAAGSLPHRCPDLLVDDHIYTYFTFAPGTTVALDDRSAARVLFLTHIVLRFQQELPPNNTAPLPTVPHRCDVPPTARRRHSLQSGIWSPHCACYSRRW
jgi:hypothetical protein